MKWITRERPKIDRIACPWLIERFIDKEAEFIYVPANEVFNIAEQTGAMPYDIPGAELSHVGELCKFRCLFAKIQPDRSGLAGARRDRARGRYITIRPNATISWPLRHFVRIIALLHRRSRNA